MLSEEDFEDEEELEEIEEEARSICSEFGPLLSLELQHHVSHPHVLSAEGELDQHERGREDPTDEGEVRPRSRPLPTIPPPILSRILYHIYGEM